MKTLSSRHRHPRRPPRRQASFRATHIDQRGLEALQTVMILAIAGVSLLLVKHWWPHYQQWFSLAVDILIEI